MSVQEIKREKGVRETEPMFSMSSLDILIVRKSCHSHLQSCIVSFTAVLPLHFPRTFPEKDNKCERRYPILRF